MRVKAMFSVIPIGVGVSLSKYIAACEGVLEEAGLERQLHAHGTNVEGEWDDVMAAIKPLSRARARHGRGSGRDLRQAGHAHRPVGCLL